MSEELKPCPFCGGEARADLYGIVDCSWCFASNGSIAEQWNTRPIEDELRAENERLRAEIEKMPRWIPVSSGQLPPEGEDVAIAVRGHSETMAGYWTKIGFMTDGSPIDDVTHWMPLPEPPDCDNPQEGNDRSNEAQRTPIVPERTL